MKTAKFTVGMMPKMQRRQPVDPMPQLRNLRRVSLRYQTIMPLSIMTSCHCIVIGKSGKTLTVAFRDQENTRLIEALYHFTGYTIFPVYVSPAHLRLLIFRLNRDEKQARERLWRSSVPVLVAMPVRTMVNAITSSLRPKR